MSLLKLKKSSVSGKVPQPADLQFGELALNYADGILFYKNANNSIASISGGSGQVVSGSGGIVYVTKSSNYTAVDKDGILADTSAGPFTITLPASPTIGTQVFIADKANWGINNLIISGNGATIEGVVQDKIVDVGNISIHLVYNGTTWQLFAQPGIVSTLIEAGSVSDVFTRHSFTATSNQTVFPLIYTPGQVEVYVNGVLISTGDYTATNGTSVVFTSGVAQNSIVEIKKYSNISLFTRESIISTAGQAVINTTYIPSLLEVYINGVLANSGDYTATNGTSIVFTQALPAGIVVDIKKYAGGSTFSRNVFTATAGQTTFPILYIKGLVEVYLNGVLASPKDYIAADGSNIVFNTPLTAGTLVYVKKFSLIPYGALDWNDLINKPVLGTAAATDASAYATAAQGTKADTAVQPGSLSTVATTGNYGDLLNKPVLSTVATSGSYNDLLNKPTLGTAAATDITAYATAAQGTKADTAVQPGSLSIVATSGNYTDLLNKPTLGTAAATNSSAYATAAQGIKADTAVQPGSLSTVATTGSYTDLTNKPIIPSITGLATETYVDTRITNLINGAPAVLDTLKEISDQLATDESAVSSLVSVVATKANTSSLSTVATTGSYNDLLNKPTLGTAAATNSTAYATAAQGTKADTAVQPGSLSTVATTGSYTDLLNKPTIGIKYVVKTTNYVAKDGDYILADTSSGSFGISMPAAPTIGMQVVIADIGNWAVNTLAIAGNGTTIDGVSSRTLSTGDITVQCVYDGTTWKLFTFPNIIDSGSGTISDIFVRNTYTLLFSQAIFKLNYTPGLVEVYINGVLIPRTEYTATNGTSITFNTAVPANSIVDIKRYSSLSLFTRTTVTTYANQSVFSVPYIPELLEVFVNGIMVNTNDYTATNGTQVVFNSGLPVNTIVEFKAYSGGSTFKNNIFTATAGQQTFLVQHVKEFTEVYLNGVLTTPEDYLSSNNSIWFYQPLSAGTLVYIKKFSKLAYGELDWGNITAKPTFATVATSGSYNDLLDKPISFSGSYLDLSNKPTLFSGAYADLTGKPTLFSGSYTDLTNKPTIPSITGLATETYVDTRITNLINGAPAALDTLKEISDQLASDESAVSALVSVVATKANTSSLSTVATTGSYTDLLNKPTLFSGSYTDLTNRPTLFSGAYADLTGKPTLFSGSYLDLTNKPTLFSGTYSDLTGKPTLSTVATTGSYNDLLDKPAGGTTYVRKTANYTASDRDGIIADTSAGPFTISLPATPTLGMQITIVDGDNWGTNNLIVARNGSTIETAANDLTLDIPGVSVQFIYDGTTWEVFAQAGALSSIANPTATFVRTSYTATASQTIFAATYAVGLVEVFVNGLLLPTTDYTAANGTSIILNTGVEEGSLVDIKSYSSSTASLLQTDWSTVTNKPTLFSGSYTDLTNKPTIPTVPTTISSFTNDSGYLTAVAGSAITGTSLAANIVSSSLTSLGTLTSLTVTNNATVSGQVITPNLTGFRVYGSGSTNNLGTTVNTHGALTGSNFAIDFQQGTALNTTTGVFTAPTAGLYQVNIVVRNSGYSAGISQAAVVKNATGGNGGGGSVMIMVEFAASSTMNHVGGSAVVKLAVGDTLALKVLAGQINFDSNDNWSLAYLG